MKEIFFEFHLRPTAATVRFSPEIQILVNQPLHASLKKLTNSLYFARRASKERDASIMPILIWLSPLFYAKVRAAKETMRPFKPPWKAVDLTIGLTDLYICTSCQLKDKRRPTVSRANPTLWVPVLLPRGGGRQQSFVHWDLCNRAGNTLQLLLWPHQGNKNAVLGNLGSISRPLLHKEGGKKQTEDTGEVSDPLRPFSHVPKVLLLLSSSLHPWHQEDISGCLGHALTLHLSLQADRHYG